MNNLRHRAGLPGILMLILLLAGAVSCVQALQTTVPPEITPTHAAGPAASPYILGASAQVLIEDGQPTGTVSFSVNTPGTYITPDWAGDVIYYLDVPIPDTPGQPATTAPGSYNASISNFYAWDNLSPGEHVFRAQLVTPDLTPLEPHVHADIEIDVTSPGTNAPAIYSLSFQTLCRLGYRFPGATGPQATPVPCGDINVSPRVLNFTVVASKIGAAASPGEGHFIYYFNVDPPTTPGQQAFTKEGTYAVTADSVIDWLAVAPGEYTTSVQLVNNDNTPLQPPVIARATFIVPVDAERAYGQ